MMEIKKYRGYKIEVKVDLLIVSKRFNRGMSDKVEISEVCKVEK